MFDGSDPSAEAALPSTSAALNAGSKIGGLPLRVNRRSKREAMGSHHRLTQALRTRAALSQFRYRSTTCHPGLW